MSTKCNFGYAIEKTLLASSITKSRDNGHPNSVMLRHITSFIYHQRPKYSFYEMLVMSTKCNFGYAIEKRLQAVRQPAAGHG